MFKENQNLITEAGNSKKLPNVVWAIILALIFLYGGSFIGAFASIPIFMLLRSYALEVKSIDLIVLLISLLSFAFISFTIFFRVKVIEKRNISSLGFEKNNWIKKYLIGFVVGLIMMTLVVLLLTILGCVTIESAPSQPIGLSAIFPLLIILIGWIIQGGTEEILARGWLMNVLGARYNIPFGLIISSIFFGMLHLGNPNVSYVAIINIVLVGLFFGLYVIKTNDLWGACGMHSAWNFAQGNLFGFEVSGLNVEVGSLIDLNLRGNELLSGGIFGPEAGLGATFVLLASIFVLVLLDKKGVFSK